MSDHVSLRFTLLDAQVVDADDRPVGRIDDLFLDVGDDGARVAEILIGTQALGERVGGLVGTLMAAIASRPRTGADPSPPPTVDIALVEELEPLVKLSARIGDLPGVAGLERWLAHHIVEPIPGAGDARE
jgi:hypothetical protein